MEVIQQFRKLNQQHFSLVALWEQIFQEVFEAVLESLTDENQQVIEMCLTLIREMLSVQPHRVQNELQQLLQKLIICLQSPDRKVQTETEDLLEAIIDLLKPQPILQSFLIGIKEESNQNSFPVIIRLATKVVKQSEKSKIMQILPDFSQILFQVSFKPQRFNHSNADVRKSVVFCLVELHYKLGEVFGPYLQQLSQSQYKLVEIYIKRRQTNQEQ